MPYFDPFQPNPIVPAQQSNQFYNITESLTEFTFPTSNMVGENYLANVMRVQTDAAGYALVLPDARTAGVGYSFIIWNVGTFDFTVLANDNSTVYSVIAGGDPGVFFSLNDNTTQAGSWFTASLAVTAPLPDVNNNAGNGLGAQALTNTLWVKNPINNMSSPSAINLATAATTINWTGGTNTLNLPAITIGETYPNYVAGGYFFYVKNSSPTNGVLTIVAPATYFIDGAANITLNYNDSCMIVMGTTGNYHTIGLTKRNIGTGAIINSNGIQVVNGTNVIPSYGFISYPSLGIYTQTGADLTFTNAGSTMAQISNANGFNLSAGQIYWFEVPYAYYQQCM